MATARERLDAFGAARAVAAGIPPAPVALPEIQPRTAEEALASLGVKRPGDWESLGEHARLDYLAEQIVMQDRKDSGITSLAGLAETGILSEHQLRIRRRHEVVSNFTAGGDLSVGVVSHGREQGQGVFGRTYVRDRWARGRSSPDDPYQPGTTYRT